MAHQRIITLLGLNNRRRFQIKLIKPMNNLFQISQLFIETSEIHITSLFSVAIRVEGVRSAVLVIGENTEVLGPVSEGRGGVHKAVGSGDGFGDGETLQEESVG